LAAASQQILVIDRKIAELSTLRTQLQSRHQIHGDATLAQIKTINAETTAELNRAKAVMERTQREISRATTCRRVASLRVRPWMIQCWRASKHVLRWTDLVRR